MVAAYRPGDWDQQHASAEASLHQWEASLDETERAIAKEEEVNCLKLEHGTLKAEDNVGNYRQGDRGG